MIFNIRIIFTIKKDRRRQKDKKRQNDKKTNKDRIIKKTEGQKETSEIYSNCATSCCTIDLNSNVSYEIMKSMVLDTSNLLGKATLI